jgi:hypothetical protein
MHVTMLSFERAKEKVSVHYDGDTSQLVSINRGGILADTPEQIQNMLEMVEAASDGGEPPFGDMDIVYVQNRFARPSHSGYRDLRLYLRDRDQIISMLRVVSRPFERETYHAGSMIEWQIARMVADRHLDDDQFYYPYVLVRDNFLRDEPDSLHMVSGFSSVGAAHFYAFCRLSQSLRELRSISTSAPGLIDNWMLFGEDAMVIDSEEAALSDQPIESRMIDCDSIGMPLWLGDDSRGFFKVPILAHEA